ncbi:hypothetical protein M5689_000602 [Euphorbia peplus]|nr:hypothetical protein M5689_000602 [Euphorbia peplus]
MDPVNMSSASKYFLAFLCIFMILNAGQINAEGGAKGVNEGPCSKYRDCNEHCMHKYGSISRGSCEQHPDGNFCVCTVWCRGCKPSWDARPLLSR